MTLTIRPSRFARITLIALLIPLALSACTGGLADKVWLEAPGWSRGISVGTSSSGQPVAMELDPDGNLWLLLLHGQQAPELVQVSNADGIIQRLLLPELRGRAPASPSLTWVQDSIVISWLEGELLYAAQFDLGGGLIQPPQPISGLHPVESFQAVARRSGAVEYWFSGGDSQPGVYTTRLNSAAGPQVIDPDGIRPFIILDQEGLLHAVWIEIPSSQGRAPITYWVEGSQTRQLAAPSLRATDVFEGPLLGLEDGYGYMFYVISIRTGLRAGDVDPMLVAFPLDAAVQASEPQRLTAPGSYGLAYESLPETGIDIGPRAQLPPPGQGTAQLTQFDLPSTVGAEVPLAFRIRADFLMNQNQGQIGLISFDRGQTAGYQLLTFTTGNSQRPNIELDAMGHAYMTWQEASEAEELTVYLASSKPAWAQSFASLTGDDIQRMLLQSLFGMAAGIILIPMVLLWLIAPVLIIVLTSLIRRAEDHWRHPLTWMPLAIGIAAYWWIKRGMLPAIFEYVPFSAWIPIIPLWLEPVLRFGLPVAGSLLALWVAYRATFGQERNSPTFFILIFGAVDGAVSMMLYGGLFLGF